MGIILALIKKEVIQTLRDARMRLVIFIMPIIQMIIFGVAITNDVKNLPITLCDQDQSRYSREVERMVTAGNYFRVLSVTSDCRLATADLEKNRVRAVIVIPYHFQSRAVRGDGSSALQILMDGSDGNTTTIAMGYLQRILMQSSIFKVVPKILPGVIPPKPGSVGLRMRVRFNHALASSNYLVPGVVTMILTIITILLTAMGITREKESGTFEQLVVSPIRGYQLVIGKTVPYAMIGFFDAFMVTLLSVIVFDIPIHGSLLALAVLNIVYITAMLGLGLFISTVSRTQEQAMMSVFGILFPALILSDFFFPLENMPLFIQWLTLGNPMRYALTAQREVVLRGAGFQEIAHHLTMLLIFSTLFLGYGVIRFRKSLSV